MIKPTTNQSYVRPKPKPVYHLAKMPRAKCGFRGCNIEYVGPNPVSGCAKIATITIVEGIFVTALTTAGAVATWYFKEKIARKLGWKTTLPVNNGNQPPITNAPDILTEVEEETFNDVIERAKEAGTSTKRVCGPIRPGERIIIAGSAGHSKSLLAAQMGIDAALKRPTNLFPEEEGVELVRQTVILYDAEQEDDDMCDRYGRHDFIYPVNLKRVRYADFDTEDQVVTDVEVRVGKHVMNGDSNITVILDNITAFFSVVSGEKIRKFYKSLQSIQARIKAIGGCVTFIVLTHTTKVEDHQSVSKRDVNGNANISNFATRVLAIRPTNLGKEYRMLKELKNRKDPEHDTVSILKICDEPYVHLEYQGNSNEAEVLPVKPKAKKPKIRAVIATPNPQQKFMSPDDIARMWELHGQGKTQEEISAELGFSRKTIGKKLKMGRSSK